MSKIKVEKPKLSLHLPAANFQEIHDMDEPF